MHKSVYAECGMCYPYKRISVFLAIYSIGFTVKVAHIRQNEFLAAYESVKKISIHQPTIAEL